MHRLLRFLALFLVTSVGLMALRCPDDDLPTAPTPTMALHFSPPEVERGRETTAIVTRSPADELQVVALSTPTPGLVSMPSSVTMSAGQTDVSFPVGTLAESTAGSVTIVASTTATTASAQLFLRDREDSVAPLRIKSAALDNDDVIGGDDVGVTVRFTRQVREADGAFLQVIGGAWWPRRDIAVPSGVSSVRFILSPDEVDEKIETVLPITYKSATQSLNLPLTLLPAPKLTSISPTRVAQGNTVTVILAGRNLLAGGGTTILVSGSGITISNVTTLNPHALAATFTIDLFAPEGAREVRVRTNHGTTRPVTFTVDPG